MHRTIRGGVVALAVILASHGTALAQSVAGSWKASLGQAQLVFTFKSAGSAYKGTFTTTTSFTDTKGKRHKTTSVQQLTATSKVANKQQTITITIQPEKGALIKQAAMITCTVVKSGLSCYSPVTRASVTFVPTKP